MADVSADLRRAFISVFNVGFEKDLVLKNYPKSITKGDIIITKLVNQKQGKRKGVMSYKQVACFVSTLLIKERIGICKLTRKNNDKNGEILALNLRDKSLLRLQASQKALKALPPECVLKVNLKTYEILEVLGSFEDESIDERICLEQYNIQKEFSDSALQIAQSYDERVKKHDYKDRKDYTKIPFCVIDPKGAKDHDDAIYYDKKRKKLYVAIADVSEYVPKDSVLDKEARARSFSVYFPESVVPMLPPSLSSNLCSLKKKKLRLALVWEIELQKSRVRECVLNLGIIKVQKSFDYEEVDFLLKSKNPKQRKRNKDSYRPKNADYAREAEAKRDLLPRGDTLKGMDSKNAPKWLKKYAKVVKKLRAQRLKNGYDLQNPEPKITLENDKSVKEISLNFSSRSHHIIEESMLLANVASARLLDSLPTQGLFRIHQSPRDSKVSELLSYIEELGAPLLEECEFADFGTERARKTHTQQEQQGQNPALHAQISSFQAWADSRGMREIVDSMIIRFFAKAAYAPIPRAHFGLGFARYTHFTSPIRRYCDLCVHRILKDFLLAKKLPKAWGADFIACEINLKERDINSLQRDFLNLKYMRFVRKKQSLGEELRLHAVLLDPQNLQCVALEIVPQARIFLCPRAQRELRALGEIKCFSTLFVKIVGVSDFGEIFAEVVDLPKIAQKPKSQRVSKFASLRRAKLKNQKNKNV